MLLTDSVRAVPGVGEKTEKLLKKLGIVTVEDLLAHIPRRYQDFRTIDALASLPFGASGLFCVQVCGAPTSVHLRGGLTKTSFIVMDDSGAAEVVLFNQIYFKQRLRDGQTVYIYGKLTAGRKNVQITSPQIFFERPQELQPVYALTTGLSQGLLRKTIACALQCAEITDPYSQRFLERYQLMPLKDALHILHDPTDEREIRAAKRRMAADELLLFSCALAKTDEPSGVPNQAVFVTAGCKQAFLRKLPFEPTGAQLRVMDEICADVASRHTMNRLIQGDVGCGKTVVAFFAMFLAAQNGYQSALMAPTEILAQQHFKEAQKYFPREEIVLITGAQRAAQRKEALQVIARGKAKIVIGTHALVCGDMGFANLGLIITDEQHKFGVKQRARLSGKKDVHTLIMSATPIPRSLLMVLYRKSSVSQIDELPPGRKPVETFIVHKNKYAGMIGFLKERMDEHRQIYMVCPLIEDAQDGKLKSVNMLQKELTREFAGYTMGLLHGKMKNAEKADVMARFAAGGIDVLVSTTVVEVGVNVPNATVMCVLNAERFGLAQLHQLRGRVGRGAERSYCFLVSDHPAAYERLQILKNHSDGFEIAQKDMELRGGGDIFGTRQHGEAAFRFADLYEDVGLLKQTQEILVSDAPEFAPEREYIRRKAEEKYAAQALEIVFN